MKVNPRAESEWYLEVIILYEVFKILHKKVICRAFSQKQENLGINSGKFKQRNNK